MGPVLHQVIHFLRCGNEITALRQGIFAEDIQILKMSGNNHGLLLSAASFVIIVQLLYCLDYTGNRGCLQHFICPDDSGKKEGSLADPSFYMYLLTSS